MVVCLQQGADLHTAQLMPLPLTASVFCFGKIQIGFTFLLPAHPGSPGQRAVKRPCVENSGASPSVTVGHGLLRSAGSDVTVGATHARCSTPSMNVILRLVTAGDDDESLSDDDEVFMMERSEEPSPLTCHIHSTSVPPFWSINE